MCDCPIEVVTIKTRNDRYRGTRHSNTAVSEMHMDQIWTKVSDGPTNLSTRSQVSADSLFATDLDKIDQVPEIAEGTRQASDNDATKWMHARGMHARHEKYSWRSHGILTWAIARTNGPSPSLRTNKTSSPKKAE